MKGRTLLRDGRAAVAVDDDTYPFAFVLADGPPSTRPRPTCSTGARGSRRATSRPVRRTRSAGATRVAGELLVRLHPRRLVGEDDVAGPGRRE